ncbi:MAG TPA: hypothetical protein VGF43_01490 [Dongiaceae bacterium]
MSLSSLRHAIGVALLTIIFVFGAGGAAAEDLTGRWTGTYKCYDLLIALELVLQDIGDGTLWGTFAFSATPTSPSVPSGSFYLWGLKHDERNAFELNAGPWIKQPSGYSVVNLKGLYTSNQLNGRILFGGCTEFEAMRAGSGIEALGEIPAAISARLVSASHMQAASRAPAAEDKDGNKNASEDTASAASAKPNKTEDSNAPATEDEGGDKSAPEHAASAVSAKSTNADGSDAYTCEALTSGPFDQIDPQLAVPACRQAVAENATSENAFRLGRALDKAENYPEALGWYRKAAEQGHARAQNNLGILYDNGQGVSQDYAEAARWYRKAAELGYVEAQYNLGNMYYEGQGVERDYIEAKKWFQKGAEQQHARSLYALGTMWTTGRGGSVNLDMAAAYFTAAERAGDPEVANAAAEALASISQAQDGYQNDSPPPPLYDPDDACRSVGAFLDCADMFRQDAQ